MAHGGPEPKYGETILLAALATALPALNSILIAVALPEIEREVAHSVAAATWLVTPYLIIMAAVPIVAGRFGDIVGRRAILVAGLVVFGTSSLAAGFADSFWLLAVFRGSQAIGAAAMYPNALALVRTLPEDRTAWAVGVLGSATAVATAGGLVVGGLVVQVAGWPGVFFLNIPLALVALALTARVSLPASMRTQRFDLLGALLLVPILATTAALLYARPSLSSMTAVGGILLLGCLGAWLLRHELEHPAPIFQPRFFRAPGFAAAVAALGISYVALYAGLLVGPLFLAGQAGWSSGLIGVLFGSYSFATFVFSPIGGRLARSIGNRMAALLGLATLAAAYALMGMLLDEIGREPGLAIPVLCLQGAGFGLSTVPLQTAALNSLERSHAGVASGMLSTSRYLGSILGASLVAFWIGAEEPAVYGGFDSAFLVLAAVAAAASLVTVGMGRAQNASETL